jgi:hypothetical protein
LREDKAKMCLNGAQFNSLFSPRMQKVEPQPPRGFTDDAADERPRRSNSPRVGNVSSIMQRVTRRDTSF